MNYLLSIPMEVRLTLLFVLGVVWGGQLNRGIYRLAWNRRAIGPWSSPVEQVPPRRWWDRLPVVGWWGLRREATWHGAGYWFRPLVIELGTGIGFAVLYWLETQRMVAWPALAGILTPDPWVLHCQYLSHILLISLMIVATFIDFDEQTIPDEVTVTGTVLALMLAVALPWGALPTTNEMEVGEVTIDRMVLTSSTLARDWEDGLGGRLSWPPELNGSRGLLFAVAGILAWCLAILHRTWTLRHGFTKALQYMIASIRRRRTWRLPAALAVVLTTMTLVTWFQEASHNGERWQSLLTAIAGMCFGGALIWAVRLIGGYALQVEAMGFGDVTLMAMIGAFLGWQAAFLVFFLAPLTAVLIATLQRLLTGNREIAFGPYLCLATVIVLIAWDAIWGQWARPMFSLGWFIPGVLACCLMLMGGMLWIWRIVRDAIFGAY